MGAGPFTVFCPNDDAFVEAAKALKLSKIDLMVHSRSQPALAPRRTSSTWLLPQFPLCPSPPSRLLQALPNMPDILKYHVVAGKVMSTDLKEGQEARTLTATDCKTAKLSLSPTAA